MPLRSNAWRGIAVSIYSWSVCALLFAACGEPGSQEVTAPTPPTALRAKEPLLGQKTASESALPEPTFPGTPPSAQTGKSADAASEQEQVNACAMEAMEKCSVVLNDPKTHVACIKRNVTECTKTQ